MTIRFISIKRKDREVWDGTEIVFSKGKALVQKPFDFRYRKNGQLFMVEFNAATESDGSSTPLGLRKSRTKAAGVAHDKLYRDTSIDVTRREADFLFREILRSPTYTWSEYNWKRKTLAFIMWAGVRIFGWIFYQKR